MVGGREHDEGGTLLTDAFNDLTDYLDGVDDLRQRALLYAASATRHQFYFDRNKRTAKLMTSRVLMSAGFNAISVPYGRLYETDRLARPTLLNQPNDATSYMNLLADCTR